MKLLKTRTWKIKIAHHIPSLPISTAITSSLSYKGVVSFGLSSTAAMI